MPVKWKIFRIANYVLMAFLVAFVLLAIVTATNMQQISPEDFIAWSTLLFCFLVMILVAANNLFLLAKFYPDRLPDRGFSMYSRILFVVSLPVLIVLLCSCGIGIYSTFLQSNKPKDPDDNVIKALVVLFVLMVLMGIYCLWFQVVLRRQIRRNIEFSLPEFL